MYIKELNKESNYLFHLNTVEWNQSLYKRAKYIFSGTKPNAEFSTGNDNINQNYDNEQLSLELEGPETVLYHEFDTSMM